jgi:cell division protein FtsL
MSATFSRSKSELNRAEKIYYTLCVVLVVLSILVYTYPSMYILHKIYLHRLVNTDVKKQIAEQNRLKLEYELLMAAGGMELKSAAAGFVEPSPGQVVFVEKKR